MATGPEHYRLAEELLDSITNSNGSVAAMDGDVATIVEAALAHATLATAAATAMAGDLSGPNAAAWAVVAGAPVEAADARRRAAVRR